MSNHATVGTHCCVFSSQILWCFLSLIFYMFILTSLWLFCQSLSLFAILSLCHSSYSAILSPPSCLFVNLSIIFIFTLQGVGSYGKVSHLELSMDGPDLLHSILTFYETTHNPTLIKNIRVPVCLACHSLTAYKLVLSPH